MKKPSKAEVEAMKKDRMDGMLLEAVGKKYGLTPQQVIWYAFVSQAEWERRNRTAGHFRGSGTILGEFDEQSRG